VKPTEIYVQWPRTASGRAEKTSHDTIFVVEMFAVEMRYFGSPSLAQVSFKYKSIVMVTIRKLPYVL
jgi:hypothetical protein